MVGAIAHPLPVETLHALLRLDPETGKLYWRERGPEWFRGRRPISEASRWNKLYAAREAAWNYSGGYVGLAIFDRKYLAHRVVFAMTRGYWPEGYVDHINGLRADNRPANLREATACENQRNRGYGTGTSRFKGVSLIAKSGRWQVYGTTPEGKNRRLGSFADEAEAARAYDDFARAHYGEFARLNFP